MRKDEYKNIYSHQERLWWYRGMAQIQTTLLKKYVTKKQNAILDAGCGTGAAFGFLLLKRFPEMIIFRGKAVSDMRSVHPFFNILFYSILQFEAKLIDVISLPWGRSLICVAQKKKV